MPSKKTLSVFLPYFSAKAWLTISSILSYSSPMNGSIESYSWSLEKRAGSRKDGITSSMVLILLQGETTLADTREVMAPFRSYALPAIFANRFRWGSTLRVAKTLLMRKYPRFFVGSPSIVLALDASISLFLLSFIFLTSAR